MFESFEIIGWTGAVFLSICGLPQAYKTFRTKSANDLAWGFLLLWFFGEICCFAYVVYGNIIIGKWQLPLIANYIMNIFIIVYLFYAKKYYGTVKCASK